MIVPNAIQCADPFYLRISQGPGQRRVDDRMDSSAVRAARRDKPRPGKALASRDRNTQGARSDSSRDVLGLTLTAKMS